MAQKKYDFATTTSITSTYAGEFAGKYISAALLSGSTIENGLITVKPNVKFKEVLKKVATDANVIKDATCDFTPTGTLTLTEKKILEVIGKQFKWALVLMITYLHHFLISF